MNDLERDLLLALARQLPLNGSNSADHAARALLGMRPLEQDDRGVWFDPDTAAKYAARFPWDGAPA
jgi:hypothetical protein